MQWVWHMRRTSNESATAPSLHSATDPAKFNAVCRSKPNLLNQTNSNAALLLYLTHQLGSKHEWNGVWNGPKAPSESPKQGSSLFLPEPSLVTWLDGKLKPRDKHFALVHK